MKIAQLTSVHYRHDTRIYYKISASLAAAGHDTTLVVADGQGDEESNGIRIRDVGGFASRLTRIIGAPARILEQALRLDADIYHLHDPELLPAGFELSKRGKRVVFDSHEDIPRQMVGKPYLNEFALRAISSLYSSYEAQVYPQLSGIIAATPFIRDRLSRFNPNTMDINNYPLLGELESELPWTDKRREVCYVGGIGRNRGIEEVCEAMISQKSGARLNLCGRFSEYEVEHAMKSGDGWKMVNEFGFVDRARLREVLARSVAGIVTFHPMPNHIDSQPNKMFEYMSAGIPVIASDFPLWRDIVEGEQCGLLVNPLDPQAIADAIDELITNSDRAQRMGANGRCAVITKYCWKNEEKKLLAFYDEIVNREKL